MISLDTRQLEFFTEAAKTGSFTQAGKNLFVSTQAVSKCIQLLENNLGFPLFIRGHNGLTLTSFGKDFHERALRILAELESIEQLADQYHQGLDESLTIGIHSLCFKEHGGTLDGETLLVLKDKFPNVNWRFIEMSGETLSAEMAKGTLDFSINIPSGEDYEGICLFDYPMAALVSPDSTLFSGKTTATLEELSESEMVLFPGEYDFNNTFIERLESWGLKVSYSPLQMRSDNDVDAIIRKDTFALRPLQHALRTTKGKTRVLPIVDKNGEAITTPLYIFQRLKRKPTPAEKAFIEYIRFVYSEAHGSEHPGGTRI